jgi:serine/threonine protein kinase
MTVLSLGRLVSLEDVFAVFTRERDDDLYRFISDTLSSEELSDRYSRILIRHVDELLDDQIGFCSNADTRAAILFFLYHCLAARVQDSPVLKQQLDQIANQDDFIAFVCKFHNIPSSIGVEQLRYHACGTSSLIFRARTKEHKDCVLKIIQAQYTSLQSIRTATAEYKKRFPPGTSEHAPDIYECQETWILMQFISGITLSDYLDVLRDDPRTPFQSDRYISCASNVFMRLTKVLSYYEGLRVVHGDLTPLNILVTVDDDEITPSEITLIDFGPNYVLREHVGARARFAEAFAHTELFSAPEVVRRRQEPSVLSDLYSLGRIGLQLLSKTPIQNDQIGGQLELIWQEPATVEIAQTIEDLIDTDPKNRAILLSQEKGYYNTLEKILRNQIALYQDLVKRSRDQFSFSTLDVKSEFWRSLKTVWRIWSSTKTPYSTADGWLLVCSAVNAAAWYLILIFVICYTAFDFSEHFNLKLPLLLDWIPELIRMQPKEFVPGEIITNLPGRAIALTFAFVASRYYANIFATLRVVDFNSWLKNITNFFLRINCFSYFVPIMVAVVYAPKWWPLCSAVGILPPALNNLFCYLTAKASTERSTGFTVAKMHQMQTEKFLKTYASWWNLMIGYVICMFAIGAMLLKGLAADVIVYASFFCVLNYWQLYRHNSKRDAPNTFGNLARLFFSLRRWQISVQKS